MHLSAECARRRAVQHCPQCQRQVAQQAGLTAGLRADLQQAMLDVTWPLKAEYAGTHCPWPHAIVVYHTLQQTFSKSRHGECSLAQDMSRLQLQSVAQRSPAQLKPGTPGDAACRTCLNKRLCNAEEGKYNTLLQISIGQEETDDIITRDIHRTFPEHPQFGCQQGQQMLFRVLKAYSLHDLEVR